MPATPPDDAPARRNWRSVWLGDDAVGRLGRGAIATLGINVSAAAVGLVSHIVLTWCLNSEAEYGVYLIAVTTINLLVLPVVAGWDTVLTRFLGQSPQPDSDPETLHLVRASTRRVIFQAMVATLGIGVGLALLRQIGWPAFLSSLSWLSLALMVGTLPILAMSILRQGILRGLHRGAVSLVPETVLTPLAVFTVTFTVWWFSGGATGTTAILAYAVAVVVAFIAGTLLLPQRLRRAGLLLADTDSSREATTPHQVTRQEWLSLAGSALIVSLSFTIINRIDEWLLAVLDSPAAAGLYGPASRYAMFVIFGLSAVNPIFGPLVSKHQHDREELQRLAKRAARLAAVASTPLALLFMAAPWLPLSLHPPAYQQTVCVLRILAAAQWLNTLMGNAGMLLSMTGHHRDLALTLLLTALLDIGLNIVLIPTFGYVGAAMATGTAIVVWNAAAWILVRWRLGVSAGAL